MARRRLRIRSHQIRRKPRLKTVKPTGIWTVEAGGNYQRSNDYRQLALKVRAINEVDGLPTSSFKVGDEVFILQDIGTKITDDEYANFFFNGREVNGRYTYDIEIDGQLVFISDLSKDNLMKDAGGVIRVSDLIASAGNAFELQSPHPAPSPPSARKPPCAKPSSTKTPSTALPKASVDTK